MWDIDISIAVAVIANEPISDFDQGKWVFILIFVRIERLDVVEDAIVDVLMESTSNQLPSLHQPKLQTVLYLIVYFHLLRLRFECLVVRVKWAFNDGLFGRQVVEIEDIAGLFGLGKAEIAVDVGLEARKHEVLIVVDKVVPA